MSEEERRPYVVLYEAQCARYGEELQKYKEGGGYADNKKALELLKAKIREVFNSPVFAFKSCILLQLLNTQKNVQYHLHLYFNTQIKITNRTVEHPAGGWRRILRCPS